MRIGDIGPAEPMGAWGRLVYKGASVLGLGGLLLLPHPGAVATAIPAGRITAGLAPNGIRTDFLDKTKMAWQEATEYRPRTAMGRRLMEIRKRIISSGGGIRGWDSVEKEVIARRGGIEGREA
jgi:hypothetical protein